MVAVGVIDEGIATPRKTEPSPWPNAAAGPGAASFRRECPHRYGSFGIAALDAHEVAEPLRRVNAHPRCGPRT